MTFGPFSARLGLFSGLSQSPNHQSAPADPPLAPFSPAPTSYWPCEAIVGGQIVDAGTANKPLTVVSCTIGTDQNLVGAGNLSHGTDSTITAPANVWNTTVGVGSFISIWFRYSATTTYSCVWNKDQSGSGNLTVLLLDGSLVFYPNGVGLGAVAANTWHQLVIQVVAGDGGSRAYIWLNGVLVYNSTNGIDTNDNVPMHFGTQAQYGDRTFTGRYDEIAVWSQVACTQGIVDELYARGLAGNTLI